MNNWVLSKKIKKESIQKGLKKNNVDCWKYKKHKHTHTHTKFYTKTTTKNKKVSDERLSESSYVECLDRWMSDSFEIKLNGKL